MKEAGCEVRRIDGHRPDGGEVDDEQRSVEVIRRGSRSRRRRRLSPSVPPSRGYRPGRQRRSTAGRADETDGSEHRSADPGNGPSLLVGQRETLTLSDDCDLAT